MNLKRLKKRLLKNCFHTLLIAGLVATVAQVGDLSGNTLLFSYPSNRGSRCNGVTMQARIVEVNGFHTLLIAGLVATVRFFALKTFCFDVRPRIFRVIALTSPGIRGL
jgi:hypothetical protein